MGKFHFDKRGKIYTRTARGHYYLSNTKQGEPIPKNARRVGTSRLTHAGTGGAKSRGKHGGNGGAEARQVRQKLSVKEQMSEL